MCNILCFKYYIFSYMWVYVNIRRCMTESMKVGTPFPSWRNIYIYICFLYKSPDEKAAYIFPACMSDEWTKWTTNYISYAICVYASVSVCKTSIYPRASTKFWEKHFFTQEPLWDLINCNLIAWSFEVWCIQSFLVLALYMAIHDFSFYMAIFA